MGLELSPEGDYYLGEFRKGRPHGYGIFKWNTGELYQGFWVNGQKEGYGEWFGRKNDVYKGYWKGGKPNGKGDHVSMNGSILYWIFILGDKYNGEFLNGIKHGKGEEFFQNGNRYVGNYAHGKFENYGEFYWTNGAYYRGNFKAGSREGQGYFVNEKGEKYEGDFAKDLKDGYGIYEWPSGNMYKGNYKEDIRDGKGEMIWKDGSIYTGDWKNGIQHGYGELHIVGQPILKGYFDNNTFVKEHIEIQPISQIEIKNSKSISEIKIDLNNLLSPTQGTSQHKSQRNIKSLFKKRERNKRLSMEDVTYDLQPQSEFSSTRAKKVKLPLLNLSPQASMVSKSRFQHKITNSFSLNKVASNISLK